MFSFNGLIICLLFVCYSLTDWCGTLFQGERRNYGRRVPKQNSTQLQTYTFLSSKMSVVNDE